MQAPTGSGEGEDEREGREREESMGEEREKSVGGMWGEESVGVHQRRERTLRRASSEADTPFASESESERKDDDEGVKVKRNRMKREMQEVKEWVRFVNR